LRFANTKGIDVFPEAAAQLLGENPGDIAGTDIQSAGNGFLGNVLGEMLGAPEKRLHGDVFAVAVARLQGK